MAQLKIILNRLKQPSVIISLTSQILTLLTLFSVKVNVNLITTLVTTTCAILVALGILSNPDTKNKGYGDDILVCSHCHKDSKHVSINNEMVCVECGCKYVENTTSKTNT